MTSTEVVELICVNPNIAPPPLHVIDIGQDKIDHRNAQEHEARLCDRMPYAQRLRL